MQRKIIQQSRTSVGISLPTKWVKKNNIKKGQEIDMIEEPTGSLTIKTKETKPVVVSRYSLNLDDLSTFQVQRIIRGLYRSKIDEITLNFSKPKIYNKKEKKYEDIYPLVERLCRGLVGLEVIKKTEDSIILQCFVSKDNIQNIETIERRIFLMISDFMRKIMQNLDKFSEFNKKVYDIHDDIAKFCDLYRRNIVYSELHIEVKVNKYLIISLMDKLTDILRHLCNEIQKNKPTTKVKNFLEEIFNFFDMQHKLLYSQDQSFIDEVVEKRNYLLNKIENEKFTISEYRIVSESKFILFLLNDFYDLKRVKEGEGG